MCSNKYKRITLGIFFGLFFNINSFANENESTFSLLDQYNNTRNVEIPYSFVNIQEEKDAEKIQDLEIQNITAQEKIQQFNEKFNQEKIITTNESKLEQVLNNNVELNQKPKNDKLLTKSFIDKKNFLINYKNEPSLWQGATLVVAFVSLLGLVSLFILKMNRRGLFNKTKTDKTMNIISTLSITPKRQIILLQIRDREIVLSNTESGISFLSNIGYEEISSKVLVTEKKPIQLTSFIKNNSNNDETNIDTNKDNFVEKKSDILMKALKRMDKEAHEEKKPVNEEKKSENSEVNGKFPKYFSNIFESESKKDIKKKEDQDSVENVTNLIREKLRSMKPLV